MSHHVLPSAADPAWHRKLFGCRRLGISIVLLTISLTATPGTAWLDPTRDAIEAGNRLVKNGKYDEAIGKYGEVLVDQPESPVLNYNMGVANYKAGKFTEALSSFSRVRTGEHDPKRLARVAYNAGNAQYRLGAAAEAQQPQEALKAYAQALAAYRRALGVDPSDRDSKFNFEFVTKKIEDLKRRLEEQRQNQEQQPQDQDKQEQDQGESPPQEQQDPGQQEEQPDQESQQPESKESGEPNPEEGAPEEQQQPEQAGEENGDEDQEAKDSAPAPGDAAPESEPEQDGSASGSEATDPGTKKEHMSPSEAASLIDAVRNEELRPEDFARRLKGAGVAEPAENW